VSYNSGFGRHRPPSPGSGWPRSATTPRSARASWFSPAGLDNEAWPSPPGESSPGLTTWASMAVSHRPPGQPAWCPVDHIHDGHRAAATTSPPANLSGGSSGGTGRCENLSVIGATSLNLADARRTSARPAASATIWATWRDVEGNRTCCNTVSFRGMTFSSSTAGGTNRAVYLDSPCARTRSSACS